MDNYFSEKQATAIAYFEANLCNWLANPLYNGKYAVIYEESLIGIYDTFPAAFDAAGEQYHPGDYIIQRLVDPQKIVNFYWPAIAPAMV
jgi:hypothetical protein